MFICGVEIRGNRGALILALNADKNVIKAFHIDHERHVRRIDKLVALSIFL